MEAILVRKRKILGSAIVVLLMLVSTQIVFLKTAKSEPTRHFGDADVGDLWISELDVSSDITAFDYIGVAHTNATDDWINWPGDGAGYINATWSVDFEPRAHPEYYVIFSFVIFNVDDENTEIGNDTFSKTYNAFQSYDESGTLSAYIQFSQQQQQVGSQTLSCYLSARVQINDTVEAANFTVWADDRAVIGVEFNDGMRPPGSFSVYTDKANEIFPDFWAWLPGWEVGFMSAEDEMLNSQSVLVGGAQKMFGNEDWGLGDISLTTYRDGTLEDIEINDIQDLVSWSNESGTQWIYGNTSMYYDIDADEQHKCPSILIIHQLKGYNNLSKKWQVISKGSHIWKWKHTDWYGYINATASLKTTWAIDSYVDCKNKVVIWNGKDYYEHTFMGLEINVSEDGTGNGPNSAGSGVGWIDKCAVFNDSYTFGLSQDTYGGVTTITGDISNGLASPDEIVYTHAADNGEIKIVLTC